MNDEIITMINRLAQIAELRGETHREKAYLGAVLGLKALTWSIKDNIERVRNEKIVGVGKGIKNKLIEYASTGQIAELVKLENSRDIRAYSELSKIAGAGPKTVADWMQHGIYDIAELRKKLAQGEIELTSVQKYGLMYYNDLNHRIPRAEVASLGESVITQIRLLDPKSMCEITGSYRRGQLDSGDIDIITTGNYSLQILVNSYSKDPNFIATFLVGTERLTFIYKSPTSNKVRQIDVLRLPMEQYWPGILYFTGSWEFNAAMRGYAKSRGYMLNQRGLFKIRGRTESLIKVDSEREIFDICGLKYVEPKDRIGAVSIVPK